MATLSVVPPVFDTYEPDAKLIHAAVTEAIDTAGGNAPKAADAEGAGDDAKAKPGKTKKPKQPDAVTGGSVGSLSEGYAANESQDLDAAC